MSASVMIPPVDSVDAENITQQLYGLKVVECVPLRSYADRNFLVTVESSRSEVKDIDGRYVLKILNKRESKSLQYVDAQTEYLLHLKNNGINCPMPQPGADGSLSHQRRLPWQSEDGDFYNIRLFSFVPGTDIHVMKGLPSPQLLGQVGELLGNICNVNETFDHPGYEENESLFVPERLPSLRQYVTHIPDKQDQLLLIDIIEEYLQDVLPELPNLKLCPIHGDLAPSNIVFKRSSSYPDGEVTGVIDVFDTMKSRIIFEISICLGMMLQRFGGTTNDDEVLQILSDILKGFFAVRTMSSTETKLLKLCIEVSIARVILPSAYFLATGEGDPEEIVRSGSLDTTALKRLRGIPLPDFTAMLENTIAASKRQI